MQPVPASAGNWAFRDNVFDHVTLWQDTLASLDNDHNGYTPGSTTLIGSTGNDVKLLQPLTYQTGTFGNYYLSSQTPLYQAGSQTAGNAGLAQSTTLTSQAKEVASKPVSIGFHYIAANGTKSLDTDGDGVPDYLEDANGNGLVDATETDPAKPKTDGVTPDASSPVYDDVDLSGNGLVGRIKKALNLNPLEPKNPLTLTQVSTGDELNVVAFDVPVNYATLTNAGTLVLNRNGVEVTSWACVPGTGGNSRLLFYLNFSPAGSRFLSAGFRLNSPPATVAEYPKLNADGLLLPFTSANTVQFPESGAMYNDTSAYLDAYVFLSNADYTITLYNPDTTPPAYLATITNNTTSGTIQEEWNLTCSNGTYYTGANLMAAYAVKPGGAPATNSPATNQPTRYLLRATNSLSEWGPNMDVAYFRTSTNPAVASYFAKNGVVWIGMQAVVDTLIMPNNGFPVYQSYFNRFTGNNPYPGYLTSRADVTNNLLPDMANGVTKQIYIFGHGATGYIGNYNDSAAIHSFDLINWLKNIYYEKGGLQAPNPYRFVFLDACSTAGKSWRRAFGIFPMDARNQAARNHTGPQAFVAWADEHDGAFNSLQDSLAAQQVSLSYAQTLNNFYYMWMTRHTVKDCIDTASSQSNETFPFPVPRNKTVTVRGNALGSPYYYSMTNILTSEIYIVCFPGLMVNGVDTSLNNDKTYAAPKDKE